jgi:hypothetical protein
VNKRPVSDELYGTPLEEEYREGLCKQNCVGGNHCICRDDYEFPHKLHICPDKDCVCHSRAYLDSMRPPQPGERRWKNL